MTDENSEQIDADSQEGVVFANSKMPALGWLVNYAIYDGSVPLTDFVNGLYRHGYSENDEGYGVNKEQSAHFRSMVRQFVPRPRHGGSAFAHAVRSLQTKAQRVVYDDPENPLSNNKEKMRVRPGERYGYTVQWTIITIRKNREYALQRVRRGYVEGQSRQQVAMETPYRVRIDSQNTNTFTRKWLNNLLAHIWDGEAAPNTSELRNTVFVEPMEDSALPEDGRFMRQAQERLRNAYVNASTCIDDDSIRKMARESLCRMGGILPHASSGGVYFIHDPQKTREVLLNNLSTVIEHFAEVANQRNRDAMWVERAVPWWETITEDQEEEVPITAHYESGMRTLTYGSSAKQLDDIKKMYISTMQNAQAKYYGLVHKMLRDGVIDEEVLATKKAEAMNALKKTEKDLGKETVEAATAQYEEVVVGLTSRFNDIWTPDERASEEEQKRIDDRIHNLLSLRLSS